jgi:hypothetical protein
MDIVIRSLDEQIERIQDVIKCNKKPQSYDFSEETIDKLKDALRSVVITQTYLKQVDKLLGDDIGEQEFIENLISNLKDIVYICE